MSLVDAFRGRRNRPDPAVDPAFAFGAEEQTMEEIRRQTFVPPERKGPGMAARAGAVLSSLRQKIAGGDDPDFDGFGNTYEEPPAQPREEAPVYSAQTYDQPAAPDMGWENPFTSPSKSKPKATRPRQPRPVYEPVQSQPAYDAPPYDDLYGQGGYYAADPGPDPYAYAPPPQSAYIPPQPEYVPPQPEYVPPQPEYVPPRQEYYPPEGYYAEPPMGDPYADPMYYNQPPYGAEYRPGERGWYGQDNMPRRYPRRKKMKPGDFKYYFWSGSIVTGMVLTLAAFIYGCVV